MILTVTPNPSLDLLFTAERLVWDDANRVPMPRRRPGGQGINLVRAVRALRAAGPAGPAGAAEEPAPPAREADALAVAPLGGRTGRELEAALAAEGTPLRAVPIDGETRLFVGARERATGRSLLLNPRGPEAGDDTADRLLDAVRDALEAAGAPSAPWVACCGSLLPGLPDDFYAEVGRLARRHGARFVPDCDGAPLALAAGAADLLVPNAMEAGRLVGRPVRDPEGAAAAGRELLARGPGRVAVTLGARGAVLVTGEGAWWARPALPEPLAGEAAAGSAVGAGDAFLAALLLGQAEVEALREAVAVGTAVLLGRGGTLVRAEDVERVRPHVEVARLPG